MNRSPPSRIMMTTDTVGGVWTYATALSRALAGQGCEVALVTMGPRPTAAQRRSIQNVLGVSLLETDLLLEWMDPAGADAARAQRELTSVAEQLKPHLIHFNSFREAAWGLPAPVLVVAHSCVNSWAAALDANSDFASGAWGAYTEGVVAGLNGADAWVAPTAAFRKSIQRLYRPATAGRTIWNGVPKSLPHRRGKHQFILGAGRAWDAAKNLSILASVAASLDWPVKIAGATGQTSEREQLPGGRVTWLGRLGHPSLLCEMHDAAVFCSPALYEPFGLSVLEAASSGCALVLSDIATFRELWDGAALFFAPRDPDALIYALNSICADDNRRAKLQHAARERSLQYRLSQTAARYQVLYAELIGRSAQPVSRGSFAMELPA